MDEPLKILPAKPWRQPGYAPWPNARRTVIGDPRGGGSFMYDNADSIAWRGECEYCHYRGPDHEPYQIGDGWSYRIEWGYVHALCGLYIDGEPPAVRRDGAG